MLPLTRSKIVPTARSRNAFMHFLNTYRCHRHSSSMPASEITKEAAAVWKRLPLNEKYFFIEAARRAEYVWKSRNRNVNKVMNHMRKSLQCDKADNKVNLVQLSLAVKQMQLWKRRLTRCVYKK